MGGLTGVGHCPHPLASRRVHSSPGSHTPQDHPKSAFYTFLTSRGRKSGGTAPTARGLPSTMSTHTAFASRNTHSAPRQQAGSQSQRVSARVNAVAALRSPCRRPFTAAPAGRQSTLVCRAEQSATGKPSVSSPPSQRRAIWQIQIPAAQRRCSSIAGCTEEDWRDRAVLTR